MKTLLFLIFSFLIVLNSRAQDYIVIRDAPDGGGSEVTTVTMTTDDSFTLYAAGYDSLDNFMGNLKADWTLTGTLDGTPQSDTVFVFSPNISPTVGVIQAQVDNMSDATGTIVVNAGELCYIKIRCSANNSPACFPEYEDTVTVYVGNV